jgi:ABC-type polysaccharide/polyol phosphate transport system ATPase subunit
MAHLSLSQVSVDFPVYTAQSKGLINTLMGFKGASKGRIDSQDGGRHFAVHALRDVTLAFNKGDRVGLIGRNGAGKSTLLRVLSGVYEPTSGSISSDGRISALTDLMLGMDPEASGYEFIVTRGVVMGLTSAQARALTADVEDFTELGDYLHLPVRTYSSGMLLRLAFAVATAIRTDILLMDEMIGVGDNAFLAKAGLRLQHLMNNVDILVLASHNESILRQFCDTGVLLSEGRVVMAGPLETCLEMHRQGHSA